MAKAELAKLRRSNDNAPWCGRVSLFCFLSQSSRFHRIMCIRLALRAQGKRSARGGFVIAPSQVREQQDVGGVGGAPALERGQQSRGRGADAAGGAGAARPGALRAGQGAPRRGLSIGQLAAPLPALCRAATCARSGEHH